MCCTVDEAKSRTSPQAFVDWLSFWESHPPVRDVLNYSQASIASTIAAANSKKGQRIKMQDFLFDYKKAIMTDEEKVIEDIHRFFSGNIKKG